MLLAGGSVSATLGMPTIPGKEKDANQWVTISFSEAARWSFDEKIFE